LGKLTGRTIKEISMKNIILTLALLTLCTGVSSAQYELSPRLGEEIDQAEREYFGLFPAVEGFLSAKAVPRADSVDFVITRTGKADTTVSTDSTTAKNLVRFIENFEKVRSRGSGENWNLNEVNLEYLNGLAASSTALETEMGEGVEITIETPNGVRLTGKLLLAQDSSLVLWGSNNPYNWRSMRKSGKVVPVSDINTITLKSAGESNFDSGAGYGAIIGTLAGALTGVVIESGWTSSEGSGIAIVSLGIVGAISGTLFGAIIGASTNEDIRGELGGSADAYRESLPVLRENAVFPDLPPPELKALTNP
jgi:hypothetical protein